MYKIISEIKLLFHYYCLNKRKITGDKTETKESFVRLHRAKPSVFNVDYICHIVYLGLDVDYRLAKVHAVGCTCI